MRKKRLCRGFFKKLNNIGTTLMEMLVAIAILTLVVVVIFSGFATSTKLNAKARLKHNATMLAQDLLEGLKAENLQGILYKFSIPAEDVGSGEDAKSYIYFDILPMDLLPVANAKNPRTEELCENIGTFGDYIDTTSGSAVTEYIPSADGKYSLYLNNVKMDGLSFDVLVTLDGSDYKDGTKGQLYNKEEITRLANMDLTYDALVSNSGVYDTEGLYEIRALVGATMDNAKVQRRITVSVEEIQILNPNYPISSKVTAKYEYLYDGVVVDTEEDVVFNNKNNPETELRNIFFFFEPMYGYGEDEIVIENEKNRDVEVFVVKQQTMTDLSGLTAKEDTYRSHIMVKEHPATWQADARGATQVRTNLGTNLGDGRNIESQVRVTYQTPYMIVTERAKFYGKTDWNDLANRKEKEMFFDVKIEIHKSGTDAIFHDVDGFKAQWGDEIIVFSGSLRN